MLQQERLKTSFNTKQLSYIIHGGKQAFQKLMQFQKLIAEDDILKFSPQHIQTSRRQNMYQQSRKLVRLYQLTQFNLDRKYSQAYIFNQQLPLSLHFTMFLITLNNLCSDKQSKLFFQKAVKGQILGCYAQTQLGHGSDIQNLQTTATYDIEKQQFVMNTPSTSAIKWWIGDLGVYANHAMVQAQLIIKGKKLGLHSFLVPIRDSNHDLYPGVQAGDNGPKYGYQTKDNGYVKFNNYRIGRQYMLMRYSKVQKNGDFSRRGNQRISYATMLITRSFIPIIAANGLSKAATICTRYSLVRSQFKDDSGKQIPILDYQIQQDKVIPRIAQAYALMFGANKIYNTSKSVFYDAKNKNIFDRLNQTHALASGIKAVFTTDSLRGIQILRRACGGHGFSMYSGLPGLMSEVGPTPTFQGQNSILYLQTARFLLKSLGNIQKKKPVGQTVMYLQQILNGQQFVADYQDHNQLLILQNLRKIFLNHSCNLVKKAALKYQTIIAQGIKPKQAWDQRVGIIMGASGKAHTYYWIFQNFLQKIYVGTKNQNVRKVLIKVLQLYALQKISQHSSSFFQSGVITSNTMKLVQTAKLQILNQLRPEALGLVQSFAYHDNCLHSAIGCFDGKAYQRMLDWAKNKNQVNKPQITKQIQNQWIKTRPLLKPRL